MTDSTAPAKNNRAGSIGLRRLQELVTPRDIEILETVREFRLLTTRQLCELHFYSHASHASAIRACTRILGRLAEHRLLRRLDRTQGGHGGGSSSFIWALDVAGDRLLRDLHDQRDQARARAFEPSRAFLDHTLAVSEAFVSLVRASREGRFELLSATSEPGNWRTFPGGLGAARSVKPDLAVVTANGEWEDHWFIEVDRGTESIPTLLRKCHLYDDYRRSGVEQGRAGVFPRVLWLLPTERRVDLLTEAIRRDAGLDAPLFTVTSDDRLVACVAGEEVAHD